MAGAVTLGPIPAHVIPEKIAAEVASDLPELLGGPTGASLGRRRGPLCQESAATYVTTFYLCWLSRRVRRC